MRIAAVLAAAAIVIVAAIDSSPPGSDPVAAGPATASAGTIATRSVHRTAAHSSHGAPTHTPTNRGSGQRKSRPARISIPAVGLAAAVQPVSARGGELELPPVDRAGWYAGGARPGEPGRTVIVGHRDTVDGPAVFAELPSVEAGTPILVTDADGRRHRYVAVRSRLIAKTRFPAGAVYGTTPHSTLVLITCDGAFDPQARSYVDNLLVFARLSGSVG